MKEDKPHNSFEKPAVHQTGKNNRLLHVLTILLVAASIILLIAIGYDRAAPFLRMDKTSAIEYSNLASTIENHTRLWQLAILAGLLAVVFARKGFKNFNDGFPISYRLVFTIALATSLSFMVFFNINTYDKRQTSPDRWNVFYIAPDTQSYVHYYFDPVPPPRPPVYPLFIQALTSGTDYDHDIQGIPRNEPLTDSSHPLMRVAQTQKLLLLIASIVCALLLMKFIDAPLVALLFLGLYDFGFYSFEINYILTEAITQAQIFLLVGVFISFLNKPQRWLLFAGGFLCASLYLTRPASVYSGLFFAGMILWALLKNRRFYWKPAFLSILLAGVIVCIPMLHTYLRFGNLKPTPMYYGPKIAYALQIAQPEDISLMPDEQSRQYLEEAIHRRDEKQAIILEEHPDEYLQIPWLISANLNQVAMPLANEMLDEESRQVTVENLVMKVAGPILKARRFEHLQYSWNSFILATTKGTRLNTEQYGFWSIAGLCLVTALLIRGWVGYSAIILILGHLMHVMTVCIYDAPTGRYVEAAEFLVLIAVFILSWAIFDKILRALFNWEKINNDMRKNIMKSLAIKLAAPANPQNPKALNSTGELSVIIDKRHAIAETEAPLPSLPDDCSWKLMDIIHLKNTDTKNNTGNPEKASTELQTTPPGLFEVLNKSESEWIAISSHQKAFCLQEIYKTAVPDLSADMLAFINSTAIDRHPTPHISLKRPLHALLTGTCGFPVLDYEPHCCVIRRDTALALYPYLSSKVPLPAALGAALQRIGGRVQFIVDKPAGQKSNVLDQFKQTCQRLYTGLLLTLTINPLHVIIPSCVLLVIPGLLGTRRVLSGGGGFVSLFIALFFLISALILFLFGYLFDQLIKTRLQQAFLVERRK